MSERERLDNRHSGWTTKIMHEGIKYLVTYSRFPDGRLAELFIATGRVGTGNNVMARDMAVLASLALQHGVPVREIIEALEQEKDGTMRGPLGAILKEIERVDGPGTMVAGEKA